jgi:LytR cell envelope-related transcriptional attenuator
VEHAFHFEDVRPWRTAAIVASAIATLELVVLVVAGALFIGHRVTHHATPTVAAQHVATHHQPAAVLKPKPRIPTILPRARTRVVVLNGNGMTGVAGNEADALRARGYRITGVGNAPQRVTGPSLVMYRPGFAKEAKRLAHDTGTGVVTAIDGIQPSLLRGAQIVIVLGAS